MLAIIRGLCGLFYLLMVGGMVIARFYSDQPGGAEKLVCIFRADSAEARIFRARRRLKKHERLVLCLPLEQYGNRELCYIVTCMQRRDPALRIIWMREKEPRAG